MAITLKLGTPMLAPTTSYHVKTTLQAGKDKVYDAFTSGLDQEAKNRLSTWLPASLEDRANLPTAVTHKSVI